jgi:lysophospholipase L1-like esterase
VLVGLALCLALVALPAASKPSADVRPDTYLAFGDSITDGAGSSDETGYRSRLEALLTTRFGRAVVINGGRPGADSRIGARAAAAALDRHRPAVTLILFGTNDWRDDPRDPPQPVATVNSLRKIVREARARGSRPLLATLPPVNTGFDANVPAAREEWVRRVNVLIREMAGKQQAVLVDLHAALLAEAPPAALFADGIHPNDQGYAVIARAFFLALAAEATPLPPQPPAPAR